MMTYFADMKVVDERLTALENKVEKILNILIIIETSLLDRNFEKVVESKINDN